MTKLLTPVFSLGQIVSTPGALRALGDEGVGVDEPTVGII